MDLVIDVGNTRIKAGIFENHSLKENFSIDISEFPNFVKSILENNNTIQNIISASVGKIESDFFSQFSSDVKMHWLDRSWKFPFINLYETPETLGIDRMIVSSGAVLKYPSTSRLVIDAGTCITYDFVNEKDEYLGGSISPGIRLRYESLHQYTAKLPLLTKNYPAHNIGNSTKESIHSGVVQGICFEIDGYIDFLKAQNANIIIILTGGDAEFLASRLKNTIFAQSNFLLESLYQTFQFNQI